MLQHENSNCDIYLDNTKNLLVCKSQQCLPALLQLLARMGANLNLSVLAMYRCIDSTLCRKFDAILDASLLCSHEQRALQS